MCHLSPKMKQLIDYINSTIKINSQGAEKLHKFTEIETFQKNKHILEAGQRCNKIWFLKSGMVRKYHIHDGKEITSWIYTENDFFTIMSSYSQKTLSNEYLQICENSEIISITRENCKELMQFNELLIFSNLILEKAFVNMDIYTRNLNQKDAKGKYEYFKKIAPEISKRAKLGHVASILGLSQETLSRIRKK